MKYWITTSLLCLLLVNPAYAESDASKARQHLFTDIEEQSELLEELLDDQQWKNAASIAEEIAQKIAKLNVLFPERNQDEGRARDAIWEEWPEFSKRLQRFESSFRDVSSAINQGNYAQAEDALDTATSSCRSCHMSYRSLW